MLKVISGSQEVIECKGFLCCALSVQSATDRGGYLRASCGLPGITTVVEADSFPHQDHMASPIVVFKLLTSNLAVPESRWRARTWT